MFNLFIRPIIVVIAITLPVWIFVRIRLNLYKKHNNKRTPFRSELILNLFYLYVMSVIAITIVPIPLTRYRNDVAMGINLIPVINTVKGFTATFAPEERYLMESALDNIIGNIVLFAPLGFLLPILFARFDSLKKIVAVALYASVSIELIQFVFRQFKIYRTVDIDDIILNISGAIAGYFIYRLFLRYVGKWK